MAIPASKTENTFELIPAGTHVARCFQMIHLGTIEEEYMGKKKLMNKVRIAFELPLEMRIFDPEKGEQPMYISKKYTLSLGDEANLRKDLRSWRTVDFTEQELKSFDITKLVGKPCMLSIVHKTSASGNDYALIASISAMPKGMECPPQVNPSVIFEWENFNQDVFDKLHEKTQEVLKSSLEYKKHIGDFSQEPISKKDMGIDNEQMDDLPF